MPTGRPVREGPMNKNEADAAVNKAAGAACLALTGGWGAPACANVEKTGAALQGAVFSVIPQSMRAAGTPQYGDAYMRVAEEQARLWDLSMGQLQETWDRAWASSGLIPEQIDARAWMEAWLVAAGAYGPGFRKSSDGAYTIAYVNPSEVNPSNQAGIWTVRWICPDRGKLDTFTAVLLDLYAAGRWAWFNLAQAAFLELLKQRLVAGKAAAASYAIRASAALPATRTAASQPKASPAPVQAKAGVPKWAWLLAATAIAIGVGAAAADRD